MRSSFVKKILVAGAVVMAAFCESGAAEKQETAAVWNEDYARAIKIAAEKKLPVQEGVSRGEHIRRILCMKVCCIAMDQPALLFCSMMRW